MVGVHCLKKENGEIIVKPDEVRERWRTYMDKLLNKENVWVRPDEENMVEGPAEKIAAEVVKWQLKI